MSADAERDVAPASLRIRYFRGCKCGRDSDGVLRLSVECAFAEWAHATGMSPLDLDERGERFQFMQHCLAVMSANV